ncbi:DUF2384 domain-containing protein [Pontibacter qinzhouensis]|uniref:DUF2384 domain-containing protein n=1 Tax=Pontibacter qinzhouensis TaxID=2603253 RepID=A0A5C8KCW7_9BACT|nr:antitoxin Xre-like helix-turn-helix domain-containing protein [Pontibacter qinzhouensis]TXK51862.1 DUF2384 domain-containing protein [Pontibacter qinzhouensis]
MAEALKIDSNLSYDLTDDRNLLALVRAARQGIKYEAFKSIADKSPFSTDEWSGFLHLSERTFQRYKKEKRTFDPIHSEKIIEVILVYNKGIEVFGDQDKFNIWLETQSVALAGLRPKELLDTTFGISLLKDELTRIEHGVLA